MPPAYMHNSSQSKFLHEGNCRGRSSWEKLATVASCMETLYGLNSDSDKTVGKHHKYCLPLGPSQLTDYAYFHNKAKSWQDENHQDEPWTWVSQWEMHYIISWQEDWTIFLWLMSDKWLRHTRALLLPPCTGGAVSRWLRKQWASGKRNPSSRAQAIWGETSEVSSHCEEKDRVHSGRDDSDRNKQAMLLDVTAYYMQNATFLEFGFGVTNKFTNRKMQWFES